MTLLVGILCKDGVVMASDSAATFGSSGMSTIGQQECRKVVKVNDHILYSATGAIGIAQLICDRVKSLWDAGKMKGGTPEAAMDTVGRAINDVVRPYLESANWQRAITGEANASLCKSLVALPVSKQLCLIQFDVNGSPERATKELPFVALGSGQLIADPFLAFLKRVLWKESEPTVAEGRLVAVWTIDHVRRTNPGGVGGEIQLATLFQKSAQDMPKAEMHALDNIQEHLQRISSAEAALVNELRQTAGADVPSPPTAPLAATGNTNATA